MKPVICMITDRRRLGREWLTELVARVQVAAEAGVHLVQIRERDLDGGPLLDLVRRCVDAVRGTRTRIVVSDRVDVALAASAHGVHLPGNSIPPARVRELVAPDFLIGQSVHSEGDVRRATEGAGVNYLVFGTVFASMSKPHMAPAGLRRLAGVVAATCLPVLAIGGMTPATVGDVAPTGASGFAAIGLFVGHDVGATGSAIAAAATAFDIASRKQREGLA